MPLDLPVLCPTQDRQAGQLSPKSLTIISGLPRIARIAPSSRTTRAPDSDVWTTNAKFSRVESSTTARSRLLDPQATMELTRRTSDLTDERPAGGGRVYARCRREAGEGQGLVEMSPSLQLQPEHPKHTRELRALVSVEAAHCSCGSAKMGADRVVDQLHAARGERRQERSTIRVARASGY